MLTVDYERLSVHAGQRLLDLGCGRGRHTFEALRRGASVVASDLDPGVLKEVRDMAGAMQLAGETDATCECVPGDATRLPFSDAAFDRVIASEVFEHIPDDETGYAEVARVTRPGGLVAVTVPRAWPERICWALSNDYHANAGGHVRIYKRQEVEAKLESAGLQPYSFHHSHALHAPYWWLKCAIGDAAPSRGYHRMLVWQIENAPSLLDRVEQTLNPVLGKSLVVYAQRI